MKEIFFMILPVPPGRCIVPLGLARRPPTKFEHPNPKCRRCLIAVCLWASRFGTKVHFPASKQAAPARTVQRRIFLCVCNVQELLVVVKWTVGKFIMDIPPSPWAEEKLEFVKANPPS